MAGHDATRHATSQSRCKPLGSKRTRLDTAGKRRLREELGQIVDKVRASCFRNPCQLVLLAQFKMHVFPSIRFEWDREIRRPQANLARTGEVRFLAQVWISGAWLMMHVGTPKQYVIGVEEMKKNGTGTTPAWKDGQPVRKPTLSAISKRRF